MSDLRTQRERMGLSQSELALALDRTQNTISRWEIGTRSVEHPRVLRYLLDRLESDLHAITGHPDRSWLAGWLDR